MTERSTAGALLDSAESEFARRGFEDASLRAIMRQAGADSGSVHYHYGNREALARAVLARILEPLNTRRLELLIAAESRAHPDPVELRDLIEALIRPDIDAATQLEDRGSGRARLIGAIYVRPSLFVTNLVEAQFAPVADRFLPHLVTAVPGVVPEVLAWRIRWAVFGMVGALLSDSSGSLTLGSDVLTARIVGAGSAAVGAPFTKEELDD